MSDRKEIISKIRDLIDELEEVPEETEDDWSVTDEFLTKHDAETYKKPTFRVTKEFFCEVLDGRKFDGDPVTYMLITKDGKIPAMKARLFLNNGFYLRDAEPLEAEVVGEISFKYTFKKSTHVESIQIIMGDDLLIAEMAFSKEFYENETLKLDMKNPIMSIKY